MGGEINFDYTYYRLTRKRYSHMTGNDVTYEYGTSGNDKGRLVFVTDGSGSYECHYDALGNVTDETRTIALPQHSEVYQFRMLYQYDSWGRMHTMTYPDGEEITYTYQWGGDLRSMHGNKNGNDRTYIREIQYNSFGQKENVDYGNGTSAHYTYDALHRLVNLKSRDGSGALMQDIEYTFDNVSNVTRIANHAGVVNALGGGYVNEYYYDNLYRLTSSDGGGGAGSYNMMMRYTPSGRIAKKFRDAQSASVSETVEMFYGYCNDYQPHAVKRMFNYSNGMLYDLRWDEAGNLGQVSMAKPDEMFEAGRFLFWTEDNRMHVAADDRYYSYYAYDHSGERRLKLTGKNDLLDVNADIMATYTLLNEPTLYPSAYMVLTNKGYTKHYYAGTERVAARLGGGGLDALFAVIGNDEELQTKADLLFDQSLEQVNNRVLQENDLDCIMHNDFAKEELVLPIDGIPYQMQAGVELNHDQFKDMVYSRLDDPNEGKEKDVYFYHSDHLGSASWITDGDGMPVQHLQYLPYGEPFVNQRAAGYSERFTFTGKERDVETGYSYFGARYMDHELMTMWLSVDPLADKYPSISPYAYCMWNPIKLVDPDGNDWYEYTDKNTGKTEIKWTDFHSQKEMDKNGMNGKYLGQAHVVFNGSRSECLGQGNNINGQDAVTADVTVYGPGGKDDITKMTGFTMTSNYQEYSAIAEGLYDANYDKKGKSGKLKSNWVLNGRGAVGTIDNEPNRSPYAGVNKGKPVMTGIFIHSTNESGFAGANVSTGCLLLAPDDFKKFTTIMAGVTHFTVRVTRTQNEITPLMGVTGPVPGMNTIQRVTRR